MQFKILTVRGNTYGVEQWFPNCAPRKHAKVVVLTAFLTIIAVWKLLAATFPLRASLVCAGWKSCEQWWILGEANEAVPPRKQQIQFWIRCRCFFRERFWLKTFREHPDFERKIGKSEMKSKWRPFFHYGAALSFQRAPWKKSLGTAGIEHYSEYVNMPRCKKAIKVNKSTFITMSFYRRSFLLFVFWECSYVFSSLIRHQQ